MTASQVRVTYEQRYANRCKMIVNGWLESTSQVFARGDPRVRQLVGTSTVSMEKSCSHNDEFDL